MALEVETYTNAAGVVCMRLRKLGDDPPGASSSNVTPLRAGQVLAHGMIPIHGAPVASPRPAVHSVQQLTEAERAVCRQLGISEADFIAQRRAEQTGAGGASRWRSGAAGGDE